MARPPAPFVAPVGGSIEQRLAQIADAINTKAAIGSVSGTGTPGPEGPAGPPGPQGPPGTGFPDAPADSTAYGRLNLAWAPVLPLAGGTLHGALTVSMAATHSYIADGPAGANAGYWIKQGGVDRWGIFKANAESGGNAGSTLNFGAYTDTGAWIGAPFQINRSPAAGAVFSVPLFCASDVSVTGALGVSGATSLTTATAATPAASDNSTNVATTAFVKAQGYAVSASVPLPSSTNPIMDGTVAIGTGTTWARADHVHPSDTSRYAASNPSGYQTAAQVTAALPVASSTNPLMDGTVAVGTGTTWARADHVHASDTSRAPLASPVFTGNPTGPTPVTADSSVSLATTAFVKAQGYAAAGAYLPLSGGTLSGGLNFGSLLSTSPTLLATHIALYGTTYGFSVTTGGNLNLVAGGAAAMQLTSTGATVNGNATITAPASTWGPYNTGKNLLVTSNNATNPAIGFSDPLGSNWFALMNNSGAFSLQGMPLLTDSTTSPVNWLSVSGTLLTSYVNAQFNGSVAIGNGLNFGNLVAASPTDLSKHIALIGTAYGFSITGNRLNYVVPNAASHVFVVNAVDKLTVSGTSVVSAVPMTTPAPAAGDSSTTVATTAFVQAAAGVALRNTAAATAVTHATTDGTLLMAPSAACTLTLLAAATYPGRKLRLKLTTAFAVNSASANVVPLVGGSASTAILTGTAGKFALLQSDGTNWQIVEAN